MQVRFWMKVFGKYGSDAYLLHDIDHPEVVVDIIDFKLLEKRSGKPQITTRKERDKMIERYVERYQLALQRFAREGTTAVKYGAMEDRVYKVYKRNADAFKALLYGKARLRSQSGLAEEFLRAAQRAQHFLPEMTRIFKHYNVPPEVTRIAFVESMFNMNARSKVGASGIWQLMPYTAKMYIHVNEMVDERNAPLKATRAAAKLLAYNYQELKSWPLAITAYNHGAGGMMRAKKRLGTSDIGVVVQNYKSPTFGFASKNFYAEFVAAYHTYDRIMKENKIRTNPPKDEVQLVTLPSKITVEQLIRETPLTKETIKKHNPCLLPSTFGHNMNKTLPPSYELAVPKYMVPKLKYALTKIKPSNLADRGVR
jgi:membrane-bound lytic murein transglycosylase D